MGIPRPKCVTSMPPQRMALLHKSTSAILTLSRLMRVYGKPAFIRSDNGAEFTATAVKKWLRDQNVGPGLHQARQPVAEWLR